MSFQLAPDSTREVGAWTGHELVVLGNAKGGVGGSLVAGVYRPAEDAWSALSTPDVTFGVNRVVHAGSASEWLVWSPVEVVGARLDLGTGTWRRMAVANAPTIRRFPAAAWIGDRMFVWGGLGFGYTDPWKASTDGGLYDPVSDTWSAVSGVAAPTGRFTPAAVWTGKRVLVWGVQDHSDNPPTPNGVYDPATDSWSPMSSAGDPRMGQYVVWTGKEMIVWSEPGKTAAYRPDTDSWRLVSMEGAPEWREWAAVVWTGSVMIVWGGSTTVQNPYEVTSRKDGAIYDPEADRWTPIPPTCAPSRRALPIAAWTGSALLVWGGYDGSTGSDHEALHDGAMFTPARSK
jgi:hypothetical protein